MSLLRFTRTSQPQQPVGVDWSNPITRGLQVAFNGSQYLSVTPTGIVSPSFDTRPTARAGKAGIATAGDGASTSTYHAIPQSTTGEFTLFALAEQYSQLTDRRIIALTNSGDTSTVAIGTGVSDASKARLWSNIAVCDLTTTPQIFAAGTVSSVAVSVNNAASSIRFFANGAFDQSYANSINVTTRNRISFGSLRRTTNGSVFNGGVYLGLYFNRALSDAEIKSLSDNPWQIFLPTNRAIYPETDASPDITLALTGEDVVAAQGSVAPVITVPLTGVAVTAAQGTLTVAGISRPSSDVTTTGWTGTPDNTDKYKNIDETNPSDTDYITSPTITGGENIIFGITPSVAAGTWDVRYRANFVGSTADVRITLLDSSNVSQGSSSWQTVTSSYADYTASVTTTGTATRVKIEVQ